VSESAISVEWDSAQQKLVRWHIPEGFSWSDFHQAVDTTQALINSVSHPVSVLIIAHQAPLPDEAGLHHFLRLVTLPFPDQNGLTLAIVDSGSTARFLLQYVQDTYPPRQRAFRTLIFFDNEEETREFILKHSEENL
jgi:hypothetical protein